MGFCCCDCFLNKRCVDLCVPFDTGQEAFMDGEFCLVYRVGASRREICAEFIYGDTLIFDISELLPGMTYEAFIKDPDGEQMELTDGALEYDCMRFSVEQTQEFRGNVTEEIIS